LSQPIASNANERRAQRRFRRLGINLVLLLASSVVCLLLLEFAVRKVCPYFHPAAQLHFIQVNGTTMGPPAQTLRLHTTKGDFDVTVRFNQHGLRDRRDFATAKESDWFAIGDSYTMGWGVEETERFSDLLEQGWQAEGKMVNVFNAAAPNDIEGYHGLLHFIEGCGTHVRHLVVGLCMENDLRDYTPDLRSVRSAGQNSNPTLPDKSSTDTSLHGWFRNHSALYIAGSFFAHKSALLRGAGEKMGVAGTIESFTGRNDWNETVIATSCERLQQLGTNRNLVVLVIPSRRLWSGDNSDTERRIHQAVVERLQQAGVSVVDLKPVFEAAGNPLQYYFVNDPHWNRQGHILAAKELQSFINAHP
jgi:hypothetical protein